MEKAESEYSSVVSGIPELQDVSLDGFLALPRKRLEDLPLSLKALGDLLVFYDSHQRYFKTVSTNLTLLCSSGMMIVMILWRFV